ncbi:TPM domain-containing protein [Streptococcus suis]|uniref:TPM domain-containing protein n=1 Tax=Streptococcus suis TaxID=1307 RepID=UPI001ABE0AE5|nr:TPM domain-containing protein [Streptococcus suis]
MKKIFLFCFSMLSVLLIWLGPPVVADTDLEKPVASMVKDSQSYLSEETKQTIDQQNQGWEQAGQPLRVWYYVTDQVDADLDSLASKLLADWQGQAEQSSVVLVIMAMKDQQVHLQTSDRLQTLLTDEEIATILASVQEKFQAGELDKVSLQLLAAIEEQVLGKTTLQVEEKSAYQQFSTYLPLFVLVAFLTLAIVMDQSARRKGDAGQFIWIPFDHFSSSANQPDKTTLESPSWTSDSASDGRADMGR